VEGNAVSSSDAIITHISAARSQATSPNTVRLSLDQIHIYRESVPQEDQPSNRSPSLSEIWLTYHPNWGQSSGNTVTLFFKVEHTIPVLLELLQKIPSNWLVCVD